MIGSDDDYPQKDHKGFEVDMWVVYTFREESIRIISARLATKIERIQYEEQ